MTRGKSAAASARRAQADVVDATDRLRAAEVELRRVGREIAARDREIDQLRSALEQSRREHTLPGTHTAGEVAALRADLRERHRAAIRAGFAWIAANVSTPIVPVGDIAHFAELFDCEPADIVGSVEGAGRQARRATRAHARLIDEVARR